MSAEEQAPERQLTLAEFEEMFADFLNGAISLAQLRQCLVDVIDSDPDALPAVQEQVDAAMYAGRLPEQTWENLVAEIDHLVSENTPTEWSEDTTITPESDDAPLLDPSDDGPMLFDEELIEPPVLVEAVEQDPVPTATGSPPTKAPAESVAQTETTHPMPDTTELPPGTVLEERYVLVSRTEHGSMGTVYKALDRQQKEAGADDPWVAIKLITAEFGKHTAAVDTLRNEAEIGCRLEHPNIARSHALHEDGEHLFISMEWLDGESLSQMLDRKRPHTLPRDQAINIIEGLATGLAYAHAQGIVHADIKPANVFMTQGGEVKLLDFGIERASDGMPLSGGLVAKTPAYASCEVLEGDNPGFQDDLFSLAAVAYRVLTGQRPFGSANALEAEAEGRDPVPVPGLSPQQWRALSAALAWRREKRSADVQSFLTEFFGEEEIVLASPEPIAAGAAKSAVQPAAEVPAEPQPAAISIADATSDPRVAGQPGSVSQAPVAEPESEENRSGAGWLRPALAAGIVGIAAAAGWTMFGGSGSPNPIADAGRPDIAAAPRATSPMPAGEPRAVEPEPSTGTAQARISSGEAGEELLLFLPGSGIPMADDTAPEEAATDKPATLATMPDEPTATGTEAASVEASDTPTDVDEPLETNIAPTAVAAAGVSEPASPPDAEDPRPLAASTSEPAAEPPAEESAVGAATAAAAAIAAAGEITEPQPPAAATGPDTQSPVEAEAAVTGTEEPEIDEPALAEADTVSAPAEALLASTVSMAMVSPDTTQRAAEQEQDTVPLPEPVKAPEPDAYGPPPELAPPAIDEVLLSTLKFKRFVEPEFPRRARDNGTIGWVDLRFLVTAEGETADIEVLDAQPGGTFDEAAVEAVERWRFKPRRVDGEAVPSRTEIRLRFE